MLTLKILKYEHNNIPQWDFAINKTSKCDMLIDMQKAKIDHTRNLTLIITLYPPPLEINIFRL